MRGSISASTSRSRARRARSRAARRPRRARRSGSCSTTSWAIRIPGSTTNGSCGSVFSRLMQQLAAVAGVDEARRVHDRDPVPGREPRARLHEAGVPLGDRHCEPGRDQRPLARRELDADRRRPGRARRRRSTRAPGSPPRPATAGSGARSGRSPARAASAIRYGAKRRSSCRGSRATTSTPSSVSARCSIGAPSAYSSESRPPSS